MKKIVIVDDHQIVIDEIKTLLEGQDHLHIIGEVNHAKELAKNTLNFQPDLLLLDSNLPEIDSLSLCELVRKSFPDTKLLIMTSFPDGKYIREMLRTGVDGCIFKDSEREVFIDAINTLISGKRYFDQRLETIIIENLNT